MKKRLLPVCFALFIMQAATAQVEFMHSLGGKFFFYSNTDGEYSGLVMYAPRVNILGNQNNTFSIGTQLGAGFSISADTYGNSSSSFVMDAPLLASYNFGFGASRNAEGNIGGYLGGGYAMHRIGLNVNGQSGNVTLHGPVFNGGVRFYINLVGSFELGASYMLDMKSEPDKFNIFGVSASYMLGMNR